MLVKNVVADSGVNSHRYSRAVGGCEETEIFMRVIACVDSPADVLPEAKLFTRGFRDPIVKFSCLSPETELAGTDVSRNALSRGADARELVIVNSACAVHGDVDRKSTRLNSSHLVISDAF